MYTGAAAAMRLVISGRAIWAPAYAQNVSRHYGERGAKTYTLEAEQGQQLSVGRKLLRLDARQLDRILGRLHHGVAETIGDLSPGIRHILDGTVDTPDLNAGKRRRVGDNGITKTVNIVPRVLGSTPKLAGNLRSISDNSEKMIEGEEGNLQSHTSSCHGCTVGNSSATDR